jgi:GT2 family glycosyltransferase
VRVTPVGISIVIPNYNGEKLLRENLPSIIAALEQWGDNHELIIVDDCSSDARCRLIREEFPQVVLLENLENMGFSRSCNAGMARVKNPLALCINNDVKVSPDLIAPLVSHFADETVFAVTPNILAEREGRNQGIIYGLYGKGFLKGRFAALEERGGVRENLYAIGACVAYDMAKFRALGGYAEIYTPYLFEDVDISYRAWKRGWKSIYEPAATVFHFSSATIGKTKKRHKRASYFRNRFLFHWINLTDTSFILANLFHTFLRLTVSFLWFDVPYYTAFFGALRRLGPALALRATVKANLVLGDAEILRRTVTANQ